MAHKSCCGTRIDRTVLRSKDCGPQHSSTGISRGCREAPCRANRAAGMRSQGGRSQSDTPLLVPTLLAVLCGLRRGEICALRWRNVDLATGQISVVESLEQTKAGLRFKSPKSGKGRTVALSTTVVAQPCTTITADLTYLPPPMSRSRPSSSVICWIFDEHSPLLGKSRRSEISKLRAHSRLADDPMRKQSAGGRHAQTYACRSDPFTLCLDCSICLAWRHARRAAGVLKRRETALR